jgi:hypothetical protein
MSAIKLSKVATLLESKIRRLGGPFPEFASDTAKHTVKRHKTLITYLFNKHTPSDIATILFADYIDGIRSST